MRAHKGSNARARRDERARDNLWRFRQRTYRSRYCAIRPVTFGSTRAGSYAIFSFHLLGRGDIPAGGLFHLACDGVQRAIPRVFVTFNLS